MDRFALVFLALIGPGLLAATPVFVITRRRFLMRAVPATGTVLACEWEKQRDSAPSTYRLTVGYRLPDGTDRTFTEGGRLAAREGTPIQILYDPAHPNRARLAYGTRQIMRTATTMLTMGLLATLFLALFWSRFTS